MGALATAEIIEMVPTKAVYVSRLTDGYNRIYRDILALGQTLVEARGNLPYGEFQRMIERELPFGKTTAYAYIREWTIAAAEDVQPAEQLADGYTVREELSRLTDEEVSKGLAEGKLFRGVSRSQVIDYRRQIRSQHVHAPNRDCPPPSRPTRAGALTYSELVYVLIEWRRSKGISQNALDDLIGWGSGETSKYEIPHHNGDGRIASWKALGDWMQGLGIGIALVPLD